MWVNGENTYEYSGQRYSVQCFVCLIILPSISSRFSSESTSLDNSDISDSSRPTSKLNIFHSCNGWIFIELIITFYFIKLFTFHHVFRSNFVWREIPETFCADHVFFCENFFINFWRFLLGSGSVESRGFTDSVRSFRAFYVQVR